MVPTTASATSRLLALRSACTLESLSVGSLANDDVVGLAEEDMLREEAVECDNMAVRDVDDESDERVIVDWRMVDGIVDERFSGISNLEEEDICYSLVISSVTLKL